MIRKKASGYEVRLFLALVTFLTLVGLTTSILGKFVSTVNEATGRPTDLKTIVWDIVSGKTFVDVITGRPIPDLGISFPLSQSHLAILLATVLSIVVVYLIARLIRGGG